MAAERHRPTGGVTVVIPHYGSADPALSLVHQLLEQPCSHPLQVVVSDDASPEPFPETPGVEVVRRRTNGGFGSAVNSAVRHAEHRFLLVLNSDLVLPEHFVDDLVEAAAPHLPAVVAPTVVTKGRVAGGNRFPRARYQAVEWVSVLGRWQDTRWFRRAVGKLDPPAPGGARVVDWLSGEALLLERQAFEDVGGFDESFFMYAEEVDLQRRLGERGVPAVLLDTAVVVHAGASSSDPARIRRWLTRSRLRYADKWGGRRRLRLALTAATAINLATNSARRAAGRPVHPLRTAQEELGLLWRGDGQARQA